MESLINNSSSNQNSFIRKDEELEIDNLNSSNSKNLLEDMKGHKKILSLNISTALSNNTDKTSDYVNLENGHPITIDSIDNNSRLKRNNKSSNSISSVRTINSVYMDKKGEVYSERLINLLYEDKVPDHFRGYPVNVKKERNNVIHRFYIHIVLILYLFLLSIIFNDSLITTSTKFQLIYSLLLLMGLFSTIYVNITLLSAYCIITIILSMMYILHFTISELLSEENILLKYKVYYIISTTFPVYYFFYSGWKVKAYLSTLFNSQVRVIKRDAKSFINSK